MATELVKSSRNHQMFEDQESSFEERLEIWDPKKNTNKFWRIWVYGRYVVRHWGRHGSKGQWSVHRAYYEGGARSAALELIRDKRRKGYKPEVDFLDRFAREATL